MATFGMVKGLRARLTLVDSCGLPIPGPRSRVITTGFITATLSPQMRDAEEIEQVNAEGRPCLVDRTPPERKWWNASIEFCKVNTCIMSMFTGWEVVTDWEGNDAGFSDSKTVPSDTAVMVEIWSGVGIDDECGDVPTTDDILTGASASKLYGYTLFMVKESTLGDIEIGASASTFTLSGITGNPVRWGRGPYNVVATDVDNTPGRMLAPMQREQHVRVLRTPIDPPEASDDCCPLVLPTPYFGESAIDVAPDQPACGTVGSNEVQSIAITGVPTGGSYTLTFDGQTTAPIAYNANAAAIEAALVALSNLGATDVDVTGTGPYVCTFGGSKAGVNVPQMTADDSGLTGGTSPEVTVTTTVQGGVYA